MNLQKPVLIGLMGSQQHRTDVACDYLIKVEFKRISISDEIKSSATSFDWSPNCNTKPNKNILREVARCGRRIHPDYWMLKTMKNILSLNGQCSIVVPDVRTVDEAETIKQLGGTIIFVSQVDNATNKKLPEYDLHILDTGSKTDLTHSTLLCLLKIHEDLEPPAKAAFECNG